MLFQGGEVELYVLRISVFFLYFLEFFLEDLVLIHSDGKLLFEVAYLNLVGIDLHRILGLRLLQLLNDFVEVVYFVLLK